MDDRPLKTLKEVAAHFHRPAHRIIHLCEAGVVRPTVDAAGRGSVRRFSRDDAFRLLLALELQEAGVQAPPDPAADGSARFSYGIARSRETARLSRPP